MLGDLVKYANAKIAEENEDFPEPGWKYENIVYVITIDYNGEPITINYTGYRNDPKDKKDSYSRYLVPFLECIRTSGVKPNVLWDKADYSLGIQTSLNDELKKVNLKHESFVNYVNNINIEDDGIKALKLFLNKTNKIQLLEMIRPDFSKEILDKSNGLTVNVSFMLIGDNNLILRRDLVRKWINDNPDDTNVKGDSYCSVTGDLEKISLNHPFVKLFDMAGLINYNQDSAESYGKSKSENSTVGRSSMLKYINSLNYLLEPKNNHRSNIGGLVHLFWSNDIFDSAFSGIWETDDISLLTDALESINSGEKKQINEDDENNVFHLLVLTNNQTRIIVKQYFVDTIKNITENIKKHFQDIDILKPDGKKFTLYNLTISTDSYVVQQNKDIYGNIMLDIINSILNNTNYPEYIIKNIINRISSDHTVDWKRAGFLKGCINRKNKKEKQMTKGLDDSNDNVGYLLGRIFACVEHLQFIKSSGNVKTVRENYISVASSTPNRVFPYLLNMVPHYLERNTWFDILISNIIGRIDGEFPKSLTLDDQGRFHIGYYHQRSEFFKKKDDVVATTDEIKELNEKGE